LSGGQAGLKEKGGEMFVGPILFELRNMYRTVSPPGQTLRKEKGGEI
jgi:hypothetical protein